MRSIVPYLGILSCEFIREALQACYFRPTHTRTYLEFSEFLPDPCEVLRIGAGLALDLRRQPLAASQLLRVRAQAVLQLQEVVFHPLHTTTTNSHD